MEIMYITRIIFICLLISSFSLEARMYQWRDPETGTTQLSGKPPSWYRSAERGPRVIVFDGEKVIDDTAIPLDPHQSRELRKQAMIKAEEDMQTAKAKATAAEQMKPFIDDQSSYQNNNSMTEPVIENTATDPVVQKEEKLRSLEELTKEEMQAIIRELDKLIESEEELAEEPGS